VAKTKRRSSSQSRSIKGFRRSAIDRRKDNDLPQHIKGTAVWAEIDDEEGYWVYDRDNNLYLAIKYKESARQWYFIRQDPFNRQWNTEKPVPTFYSLE